MKGWEDKADGAEIVAVSLLRTVSDVADDGMSSLGKMDADLVLAAGLESDLGPGRSVSDAEAAPLGSRQFVGSGGIIAG